MSNNLYFFTDNNDVSGPATKRSQDPQYVLENHLTHNFNPTLWGSVDLRYQYGGTTTTDGVDDGNVINALGGGGTVGYQLTPHLGLWSSFGTVLAKKGDAKEHLFRFQIAYSF